MHLGSGLPSGSPGCYQSPESTKSFGLRTGGTGGARHPGGPAHGPQNKAAVGTGGPHGPAGDCPHAFSPAIPAVALPPEKTDGLASGDEKRREKASESCPGPKKQLKFEVSCLSWRGLWREGFSPLSGTFRGGRLRPFQM